MSPSKFTAATPSRKNDIVDGGATGGLTVERRFGKSWGLGVFADYQRLAPKGAFASLTAYSIPLGIVGNLYAGSSVYVGVNAGTQHLKVSGNNASLSGSENFVGGQVGLLLGKHLGLEGRYLYSLSGDDGLHLMQALLQFRF